MKTPDTMEAMSDHDHKPMFLFGSGISPAPKVQTLTDLILSSDLHRCSDGTWRPRGPGNGCSIPNPADDGRYVRHLLQKIRIDIASDRGCGWDQVTYEDIANVCTQLNKNADTGRNPALAPYHQELQSALRLTGEELGYLVWASCNYISWAVYHAFKAVKDAPTALCKFNDAILSKCPPSTVVTLNHDLYLESVLGAEVNVGFSKQGNFAFHPNILTQASGLKLLKLHGSIDWFWDNGAVVRRADLRDPVPATPPLVLAGTISKLEDYNYSVFPWLWAEFQNALRQTRRIVVSGYGFKDVGLNTRLANWLGHFPDARIAIIHHDPESLIGSTERERIDGITRFFDQKHSTIHAHDQFNPELFTQITFVPCKFEKASDEGWASWLKDFTRD